MACTCSIPCNTAHICSEMPQTVWMDDAEIRAAVERYVAKHPDEAAALAPTTTKEEDS